MSKFIPCFALKCGEQLTALSFNKSTVEALRHGADEVVIEGFFTLSRSPNPEVTVEDLMNIELETKEGEAFTLGHAIGREPCEQLLTILHTALSQGKGKR